MKELEKEFHIGMPLFLSGLLFISLKDYFLFTSYLKLRYYRLYFENKGIRGNFILSQSLPNHGCSLHGVLILWGPTLTPFPNPVGQI